MRNSRNPGEQRKRRSCQHWVFCFWRERLSCLFVIAPWPQWRVSWGLSLSFLLRQAGASRSRAKWREALSDEHPCQGVGCWQQLGKLLFPPFQPYLHSGFFSSDEISKTHEDGRFFKKYESLSTFSCLAVGTVVLNLVTWIYSAVKCKVVCVILES